MLEQPREDAKSHSLRIAAYAGVTALLLVAACSGESATESARGSSGAGGGSATVQTGGSGGGTGGVGGSTPAQTGGAGVGAGGTTAAQGGGGTSGSGGTAPGPDAATNAGGSAGIAGATGGAGGFAGGAGGVAGSAGGSVDSGAGGPDELVAFGGPVSLRDGTVDFKHQQYTLNLNNSLNTIGTAIVTTTYDVKIIENDLVTVTVLPSYGGRILSIVYRPTNQELLYQNSLGTPFGKGAGSFYYDWLLVYGGIFPTLPEPEHGKMWLLPWDATVVTNTADEIAIRMVKKDDISPGGGIPPQRFKYGRTDVQVSATVHVVRGSATVGLEIEVANTRTSPVTYEYWTCTTLAPGSAPGKTAVPANTEIVSPMDKVYIDAAYPWMRKLEQSTGEANVYYWKNLASFSAWSDNGIAYAYPGVTGRFWGALNRDLKAGVFRVADANPTVGLKMWTWGASSVKIDPNAPSDARPYIELWAGISPRFFVPAQLAASEKKHWTESYLPTLGMLKFSEVGEGAAAYLSYAKAAGATDFQVELFTPLPSRRFRVELLLEGSTTKSLYNQPWTPDATKSSVLAVSVPAADLPTGTGKYTLVLKKANGEQVLRTSVDYAG
jgi:hypothetical protein